MDRRSFFPATDGVTILRCDGENSKFPISSVEILGPVSKQTLERAVMKTDAYPLRKAVAQQLYEIVWWLRHVRMEGPSDRWSSGVIVGRRFGKVLDETGWSVFKRGNFQCTACRSDQ
jgi:hypothetical protein